MPVAWTKLIISHFSLLEMVILPLTSACRTKRYTMISLKKSTLLWSWVYFDFYQLENGWRQYLTSMKTWPGAIIWPQSSVIIWSSESFIQWTTVFTKLTVSGDYSSTGIAQIAPICANSKIFLSSSSPVISSGNI